MHGEESGSQKHTPPACALTMTSRQYNLSPLTIVYRLTANCLPTPKRGSCVQRPDHPLITSHQPLPVVSIFCTACVCVCSETVELQTSNPQPVLSPQHCGETEGGVVKYAAENGWSPVEQSWASRLTGAGPIWQIMYTLPSWRFFAGRSCCRV